MPATTARLPANSSGSSARVRVVTIAAGLTQNGGAGLLREFDVFIGHDHVGVAGLDSIFIGLDDLEPVGADVFDREVEVGTPVGLEEVLFGDCPKVVAWTDDACGTRGHGWSLHLGRSRMAVRW